MDAIAFARKNFNVEFHYSDASVSHIESIMENFDRNTTRGLPRAEVLAQFAKMFGSYIGETYRKNHGGAWGLITDEAIRSRAYGARMGPCSGLGRAWRTE